jgi:hypothetical protein
LSEKKRFQEVLQDVRSEFKFLKDDLFRELVQRLSVKGYRIDPEEKDWIFDVFLDKFYETDVKIRRIISDLGYKVEPPLTPIKDKAEEIACNRRVSFYSNVGTQLDYLYSAIEDYGTALESMMSSVRQKLYEENWVQIKNLRNEEYVLATQRARYVQAREELEKAKQAVKAQQWDEVLNHLRPAIDLSLREKLGFAKIHPMKQFLIDAEKYNLPLPSYTMLYDFFDEGTQRIHGGKLNTPYECQKALEFVAGFIDRLEVLNISQRDIGEFKKKSATVA